MNIRNGNLMHQIGILFIILSFISPAVTLLIPFLNISAELSVMLGTLFFVGLPEVFFVLGVILVGKRAAMLITQNVKAWFLGRKKRK
ncbi:MAG: transporter suffix domain-containing protein [Legionellaceae bacterium]|nr:transporter suffix domain-containing protein [Legionellaceae bacterium]